MTNKTKQEHMKVLKKISLKIIVQTLGQLISRGWMTEDQAFRLLRSLPISDATITQLFAEPVKPVTAYRQGIPRCLSKYYHKINQR